MDGNYRLNVFPIIYVSSVDGKPFEYEFCEMGKMPPYFPGLELHLLHGKKIRRWEVQRVCSKITAGMPAVFVLCSPATETPFTSQESDAFAQKVYQELIRAIEESENKKKNPNRDEEDDDSYLWN